MLSGDEKRLQGSRDPRYKQAASNSCLEEKNVKRIKIRIPISPQNEFREKIIHAISEKAQAPGMEGKANVFC